jgi:hypothetical protein
MRLHRFAGLALCAALTLTALGRQAPAPKTMDSPKEKDAFEKVHEGMLSTKPAAGTDASRLTQAVARTLPLTKAAFSKLPRKNLIDEHILGRIERDRIPHAPVARDEEFMRRAYLDATGVLPTPAQVLRFIASKDPAKRDKLIDSLVGTDEFAEQWAWFFGDLLQNEDESTYYWMKQWLKVDRPYDETFEEAVTATSKNYFTIPALRVHDAAMYVGTRNVGDNPDDYRLTNRLDIVDQASVNISRIFLGVNIDCIGCHDGAEHLEAVNVYLSERKREEFHRQAAFLGNWRPLMSVNRTPAASLNNSLIDDEGGGYNTGNDAPYYTAAESRFPRDGRSYKPAFILTGEEPKPGEDPRRALARILPTHIQFSRAAVNLIWGRLMVVGFVDPYDGFDMARLDPRKPPTKPWTIQPTNPELLDALANDFRTNRFSLHHLIKTIMKSNAYQLSTEFPGAWKDDYIPYYARRYVRVLRGVEVVDAIATATGRPFDFPSGNNYVVGQDGQLAAAPIARVKQFAVPNAVRRTPKEGNGIFGIMSAFFQSPREAAPGVGNQVTPVQAMLMMNSPIITSRVDTDAGGRLKQMVESGKTEQEIVEELFLAALCRKPLPGELSVALQLMEKDRKRGAEKVQWAMLNNTEFLLNH